MSAPARWVIPADTRIDRADRVAPMLGSHGHSIEDFAVFRDHSRQLVTILGSSEVALLDFFREPNTIPDALVAYCAAHGGDPRELLTENYAFLSQLARDGIIVRADSPLAARLAPSFAPNDRIDDFVVTRWLAFAIDADTYEARNIDGARCAIKVSRPGMHQASAMLAREAATLARLNGELGPSLIRFADVGDRSLLAMSWLEGDSLSAAARRISADGFGGAVARARLSGLGSAVLSAFAELHERGVIHGDVHPDNLIVSPSPNERVRLVDFGLSRIVGDSERGYVPRGGVSVYREPEYAAALLSNIAPEQATMAGEQYAVAALLFRLFTGTDYLAFAPSEEELNRQIVEDEPRTFNDCGCVAWPSLESVLRRALSKQPQDRFDSLSDFADAFARASKARVAWTSTRGSGTMGFLSRVQRTLVDSVQDRESAATVADGAAGGAFALYRMACAGSDAALLAAADVWSTRAVQSLPLSRAGQPNVDWRLPILHSAAGVHWVDAHVQSAAGNLDGLHRAIDAFVQCAPEHFCWMDVIFGQAGVLLALSMLTGLPNGDPTQRASLVALGDRIVGTLEQHTKDLGEVRECPGLANLGIAHGWAGLLYATMRWSETTGSTLPAWVVARLHELAGSAILTRRGAQWPWRDQLPEKGTPSMFMPGWCNGSAGFVYLWLLAARLVDRRPFEALAARATWDAWESGTPAWNICCGSAGRAYALLAFYRQTGERAWLERAGRLAADAARYAGAASFADADAPVHNLTRGAAGVAVLTTELATIEDARMPWFEAERWRPT